MWFEGVGCTVKQGLVRGIGEFWNKVENSILFFGGGGGAGGGSNAEITLQKALFGNVLFPADFHDELNKPRVEVWIAPHAI